MSRWLYDPESESPLWISVSEKGEMEKSLLITHQYMKMTHYLMASRIEKLWML